MQRREPPATEEGWYALHDFRTIDWDSWGDASGRHRDRALEEGTAFLESTVAVEDSPEGASAVFSILGHKADLLIVHLRPTPADLDALERRFEATELARYTDQPTSYVSVTEASGYTERARDYFEGELDEDSGLARYIQSRLHPDVPNAEHVCFYPMNKRRDPEYNWYDLPFEDRASHMENHGTIGRAYGGKVSQMITGSIGFDDWEWGVTLWADDPADIKDLLYEMRFDPSSSKYAEFGPFYFGRRFPPAELDTLLAGERLPSSTETQSSESGEHPHGEHSEHGEHPHGEEVTSQDDESARPPQTPDSSGTAPASESGGGPSSDDAADRSSGDASGGKPPSAESGGKPPSGGADALSEREDLTRYVRVLGFEAGVDYSDGAYGLVVDASAPAEDLVEEIEGLRENFEHYDSHVLTKVRAKSGETKVVSVWETERAADTAAGFLLDLQGVAGGLRGPLGESETATSDADAADPSQDDEADAAAIRQALAEQDIYAGKPHGEDVYALVLYSNADAETLGEEVTGLQESFDHYDTHVKTAVYEDRESAVTAVVSIWETESAADTASDFLTDLPGIIGRASDGEGFGTMGLFYTVKPDHVADFRETFDAVGETLAEMDGHRETALLINREDDADMFIASRWDSKADAMAFFRSSDFRETVQWGREILDDRPRHVFLA